MVPGRRPACAPAAGRGAGANPCACGACGAAVCSLSPADPGLPRAAQSAAAGSSPPARPAPLRSRPARRWSSSLHPLGSARSSRAALLVDTGALQCQLGPFRARGPGGAGKAEGGRGIRVAACVQSKASRVHSKFRIRQESGSVHSGFSDAPEAVGNPGGSEEALVHKNERFHFFRGCTSGCQDGRVV